VTRSRSLARALSRSLAILGPMMLGGLAASCGSRSAGSADSTRASAATSKTIGVTLLTREDEFYRSLEDGLRKAAAAHGYKLLVQSGDRDLAKQQSQIDNFIVQKVDAIIVCPVDTKGIGPAIERANAVKIPVFTADIAAQGGSVVSHVASDNVAGGKLAAEYIARAIGDSGQVGVIGENDVQTTIDRQQGFKDALAAHPKITLVAQLDGQGVRDRALKAADDLLQAHPDVAAIFAINDESAFGTLSAVQARKKKVVIVGYDAGPEARRDIAAGTQLRADVAQQPGLIGQQTIDAIASLFAGQTPPAKIAVPVTIVNADSVKAESAPR
jgi:ribose transport system substrate-binding protein